MSLRIVRLGTPRLSGEGLRIGTVRRPPRGVPKAEFSTRDFYDVWLPDVAPSEELVKLALDADTDAAWRTFERRYRDAAGNWHSTQSFDKSHLLSLAKLADQADTEITRLLAKHRLDHVTVERAEESPEQSPGGKYREVIPMEIQR